MTISSLAIAGLRRNRRAQLAVMLGIAVATAALVGALLVGDSLRGSLRDMALRRLGDVDLVFTAARGVLAERVATIAPLLSDDPSEKYAAVLTARGSVVNAATQARANDVAIWGIDADFWETVVRGFRGPQIAGRAAAMNEPLARQLGVVPGGEILLQVGRMQAISPETLLGRRDQPPETARLAVANVLPDAGPAAIALSPSQQAPLNLFVPIELLQRLTGRPDSVNTILASSRTPAPHNPALERGRLDAIVHKFDLADLRLRLRVDESRGYFALDSESMLLEPAIESAAMSICTTQGLAPAGVIAYLANSIHLAGRQDGAAVPYSIVVGFDPATASGQTIFPAAAGRPLQMGEILLNQWTADELKAQPGDSIALDYFVTGAHGELMPNTSTLRLRAILPMDPAVADPGYVPTYKGVTDAAHLSDWDPPFPMDLKMIRPADEAYWDRYRTSPKAFLVLEDARRRFSEKDRRFGQLTSMRFTVAEGQSLAAAAHRFGLGLIAALSPDEIGTRIDYVRDNAVAASAGTTDFGGLFIGFSFFLIVAAAILVALLFRLNVERRAEEIGTLRAIGWRGRRVARLFLTEGAIVCLAGVAIGLPASCGYAWLMLAGLQSWWSAAVSAPALALHVRPDSLWTGAAASWLTGMAAIALALRGLGGVSPRALLAGQVGGAAAPPRRGSGLLAWLLIVALLAIASAAGVLGARRLLPADASFFLSGTIALVASALIARRILGRRPGATVHQPGPGAVVQLAWRNALRSPGRSTSTVALVAAAVFLILSLSAFHMDAGDEALARTGGAGGFSLYAESTIPILRDPNDWSDAADTLQSAAPPAIYCLRLQPGDAGSCQNPYLRRAPRILGAPDSLIYRGGFSFAAVEQRYADDRENPWLLLNTQPVEDAIPAIGDEAAVRWQFHSDIGRTIDIEDESGGKRRLRFVALLSGSVLQDELIVSERNFNQLYPSRNGYSFFLIDTTIGGNGIHRVAREPAAPAASRPAHAAARATDDAAIAAALERRFAEYGLDVRSTRARLAGYLAVQNTYLSTFQTLGGFGLLLGTLGLAAVMLRNVWERRGELALLRAIGYRAGTLRRLVILESAQVLVLGIFAGVLPALIAVAPLALSRPAALPASAFLTVLVLVPAVAIVAGLLALRDSLQTPIAETLKRDDL